jgi:hypothetical protein
MTARLRVTFSKTGPLRYVGHLDLQTIWERTARRAGLPLAYTHGFHPGPRIQIAAALPLGFSGRAEIVDLWLEASESDNVTSPQGNPERPESDDSRHRSPIPGTDDLRETLQSAAPPGLGILSLEVVDERGPALQTRIRAAEYEAILLEAPDKAALTGSVAGLLRAGTLPRERRGKPYDLRPLIESLELRPADGSGPCRLAMRLSTREGATGRPEEVLDALGLAPDSARVERIRLLLEKDVE